MYFQSDSAHRTDMGQTPAHGLAPLRRTSTRPASVHLCPVCGFRTAVPEKLVAHRRRAYPEGVARVVDALRGPPVTTDPALNDVVATNWSAIRTYHRRRAVVDLLNVRLRDGRAERAGPSLNARALLVRAWDDIDTRSKVDCSAGCILEHKITGELKYYHSSLNDASLLGERPHVVSSVEDLHRLYDDVAAIDLDAEALHRRPETVWKLRQVTNFTFYVVKLLGIGRVGGWTRKRTAETAALEDEASGATPTK